MVEAPCFTLTPATATPHPTNAKCGPSWGPRTGACRGPRSRGKQRFSAAERRVFIIFFCALALGSGAEAPKEENSESSLPLPSRAASPC